jgi:3-hydroxyacyl-[acyl-carrier-protein] dehydratase
VRFHLIDRIDSFEPGKSVHARKLTSQSEEHWEASPEGPIMPAVLVLEALCQAGTWLIIASTNRRKRATLLSIASVSFLQPVRPGDVLTIEGTVNSLSEEMAVISGHVAAGGICVLEATDIMCALIEADSLEDLESTERMQKVLMPEADS